MRLTSHLVAEPERRFSLKFSLHPAATQKNTKAWGNTWNLRDILESRAKHARSIYGSRGHAPTRDDDRHAGYTKIKYGRVEYSR